MTAPTVTVLPKPETVLDVDLSAEVPCTSIGHGAAVWAARLSTCGHIETWCDICHDQVVTAMLDPTFRCVHLPCGSRGNVVVEWRRL